jgi:predicted NBD/HSP70 family sugar kinase
MTKTPIDSKIAGQRNEKMFLWMLRKYGPLSQTQLCQMADFGSSTASTIVARLRDKGLVIETRGESTTRGPKPVIIKLNPDCQYLFGVEINPSYVFIGLFNFTGQIKDKLRIALGSDHSVRHVLDLLTVNIPGLLNRNAIDAARVLGAGVTLSGSVQSDGWISLSSPLGWKDVSLKEQLAEYFSFPVSVYSNRVRLLAEIALDPELESKNILYLNVADGVGSTICTGGKLVFGATGRYGEIGHIVVDPDGPLCGCGNRGCLEALISGPALVARIRRDLDTGSADCFRPAFSRKETPLTPEEMLAPWADCIEKKDPYALRLRDEVVKHVSKTAAMLINCYDPDTVILAGYIVTPLYHTLAQNIRDRIKTDVYDSTLRNIDIRSAIAGKDAVIKGVANAVLQDAAEYK